MRHRASLLAAILALTTFAPDLARGQGVPGAACLATAQSFASTMQDLAALYPTPTPPVNSSELQAQLATFCTSPAWGALGSLIQAVAAACTSPDEIEFTRNFEFRNLMSLRNLQCVAVDGEYCLPAFLDSARVLSSADPASVTEADLASACSPCASAYLRTLADFTEGPSLTAMSALEVLCLKDAGQYCFRKFFHITNDILPTWYLGAPNTGELLGEVCSDRCFARTLEKLLPPEQVLSIAPLTSCVKEPLTGEYCLQDFEPIAAALPGATSAKLSELGYPVDCIPQGPSTCEETGTPCSSDADCHDLCGSQNLCGGGPNDGDACSTDTECNDRCILASGTCSLSGVPCATDSGCPESGHTCARRCTLSGDPCNDDSLCRRRPNRCVSNVCGYATSRPCATDGDCNVCQSGTCSVSGDACSVTADCPTQPCVAGLCFEPTSLACSDSTPCTNVCAAGTCSITGDACMNDEACARPSTARLLLEILRAAGWSSCSDHIARPLWARSPEVLLPYLDARKLSEQPGEGPPLPQPPADADKVRIVMRIAQLKSAYYLANKPAIDNWILKDVAPPDIVRETVISELDGYVAAFGLPATTNRP